MKEQFDILGTRLHLLPTIPRIMWEDTTIMYYKLNMNLQPADG